MGAALPQQIAGVTPYGNPSAPTYYAVALSPTGYVIVAGDDRIEPIIAFVPTGTYDPSPKQTMGALVSSDLPHRLAQLATPAAAAPSSGEVQRTPATHNRNGRRCLARLHADGNSLVLGQRPARRSAHADDLESATANEDGDDGVLQLLYAAICHPGQCHNDVCGCVATAMAQFMRYWQYPTSGVGTASFPIFINGERRDRDVARRRWQRWAVPVGEYATQPDDRYADRAVPGDRRALLGYRGRRQYAILRRRLRRL